MKPLHGLVPMAHVQDVERSMEFYRRLGFEEHGRHTPEGETVPVWVWLKSGSANLMVTLAGEPVVARQQGVLFYVYCEDVPDYHAQLQRNGVNVGPIKKPFFSPRGEFRVTDPDGYVVIVSHT